MPDPDETTAAQPTGDSQGRPARPRARERGRMRRRLRQQKRMREALLLDLGALVYELHRHSRREPELLQAKAAELTAVDQEVRALADALEADEGMLTLVAAGIAGSCENCGSLLATDARYCGACGAPAVPAIADTAAGASGPALTQPLADTAATERFARVEEAETEAGDRYAEPPSEEEVPPAHGEPLVAEDEPLSDDYPPSVVDDEPLPVAEEPVEETLPEADEPVEEEEILPEADEPVPEYTRTDDDPLDDEEPLAPWLADREERPDA